MLDKANHSHRKYLKNGTVHEKLGVDNITIILPPILL